MKAVVPLIICSIAVYYMIKPLWVAYPTGAYVLLGVFAVAALITLSGFVVRAARRRRENSTYYLRNRR